MNSTYAAATAQTLSKRPIICKLLRRTDKIRVMKAKSVLKGSAGLAVVEELTPYNLHLLKSAGKHELVTSAWAFNGKIFVKGTTGPPKTITCLDDISKKL